MTLFPCCLVCANKNMAVTGANLAFWVTVWALNVRSKGRWFRSRSGSNQVVTAWMMGDCLHTGKPSRYTRWAKKWHHFLYTLQFDQILANYYFFYCQNQETICNKSITIDLTTPQMCRCSTLWNVSVIRITINNKTTCATTHFKKLRAETTCLLSQLLSKKSHLTVFTSNV